MCAPLAHPPSPTAPNADRPIFPPQVFEKAGYPEDFSVSNVKMGVGAVM
jgi:hypothetical protein